MGASKGVPTGRGSQDQKGMGTSKNSFCSDKGGLDQTSWARKAPVAYDRWESGWESQGESNAKSQCHLHLM